MSKRPGFTRAIWGGLSIVAGAFMTEGGVMEAVSCWRLGLSENVVVGTLGALASALMLVSGVTFCARRAFGRKIAIAGAIGMIPVHFAGWTLGLVGVPGAIMGAVYPAALLLAIGIWPDLGAFQRRNRDAVPESPSPSNPATRRTAMEFRHDQG